MKPINRLYVWLPPFVWMTVIFFFSTSSFSEETTASIIIPVLRALFPDAPPEKLSEIHFFVRKISHFAEFAVLSLLWLRALRGEWKEKKYPFFFISFLISVLYALLDEFHQSFVSVRTASVVDVIIDSAGAASSLIVLKITERAGDNASQPPS